MPKDPTKSITAILDDIKAGDPTARNRLFERVYEDLKAMAHRRLAHERREHTLQATALVHELIIKFERREPFDFDDRQRFFSAAGRAMLEIMIDYARRRKLTRVDVPVERIKELIEFNPEEVLLEDELRCLEAALGELEQKDSRMAATMTLRYLAGQTIAQTAQSLGVCDKTTVDDSAYGRAWLRRRLGGGNLT